MTNDNTKHTPGPWSVRFREVNNGEALIMNPHGWCVAESAVGLPGGFAETISNEHLIAAAPELLEALRAVVFAIAPDHDYENIEGFFREPVSQALAAIAKAEGRS